MHFCDMITELIRKARVLTIRILTLKKPYFQLSDSAVIIAPHSDDEVFGCCGLIQRMLANGKRVELIIMTGGGRSHSNCCNINEKYLIANRRQLTRDAAAIYGLSEEHIHFLDYPDGEIAFANDNTKAFASILNKIIGSTDGKDITIFYPHFKGEGWSDHIRTTEISKTLCASICPEAKQFEYCVWFWFYNCWKIDWKNAFTLKMDKKEFSTKLKAIDAYIGPKAPCGKPWSGVLPTVFLWANKWSHELFFRVK